MIPHISKKKKKTYQTPQNSGHQEGEMKQVMYSTTQKYSTPLYKI